MHSKVNKRNKLNENKFYVMNENFHKNKIRDKKN